MREEGLWPPPNWPLASTAADVAATPVLAALLLALAWTDLRERRLPDRLTGPLAALGLALATLRTGGLPLAEIAGLAGGWAVFWSLGTAHHRLRRTEGLGLGDAKLLGAAGAWLGWQPLPLLVLGAALGALAWLAVARAVREPGPARGPGGIAFGPWLAFGLLLLWLARLPGPGA